MSLTRVCVVVFSLLTVARATLVLGNISVVGNGTTSVAWSSTDPENDPESFTIELTNPEFHTQFAIANNIPTQQGSVTTETPQLIAGPNYAIQFVNNSNANDIFAMSGSFTIEEHDVNTTSTSSSAGASSTGSAGASSSGSLNSPSAASSNGASPSPTQPGSSGSSSQNFSTPPSSPSPSPTTNPVFGGNNNNGASSLQVPFALGFVGAAFALV